MSKKPADASLTNLAAERAVLGGLLRSQDVFWQMADTVRPDHFSNPLHQQIYSAIRDVCMEGKRLSLTILLTRLPPQDETGSDVESLLAILFKNAENIGQPLDFADSLVELASRRRLVAVGEAMVKEARAGIERAIDVAGKAETSVLDVMQLSSPVRPKRLSDIAEQVMTSAKRAREDDVLPGVVTGINKVDEIIGTCMGGDLIFVLGLPGEGKSALLAQASLSISRSRPTLNIANEMTDEQVAARHLAGMSGVSVRNIREGAFDQFQWEKLQEAREAAKIPQFWQLYDPKITVRGIRAHCLAMKRTIGLGAVTIDQLTHLRTDFRHRDRFERQAEITSDLKVLAGEIGVPVFVAAQRTRTAARREDPTPEIYDADAPSLEKDGDTVLGIWRKEYWLRRRRPKGSTVGQEMENWEAEIRRWSTIIEVIGLKVRSGPAFEERQLRWNGPLTRIEELGS